MLVMHPAAEERAYRPAIARMSSAACPEPLLLDMGVVLRLKPNETLFGEGEEAAHVYQIAEGTSRSFRTLIDGRRQITSFGMRGDFVGLEWDDKCMMTTEAITDLVVLSYSRRQIEHRAGANARVQMRIMRS